MDEKKVSVIIPLAPGEKLNQTLGKQLQALPEDWEILFCTSESVFPEAGLKDKVRLIQARNGRAHCLNQGALCARGEYLWFLHADSMLYEHTTDIIHRTIEKRQQALYYFDLKFYSRSCPFMRFNEMGVFFRSRCRHTPFGDQAFLIKKDLFERLPKYSSQVAYGEDHILVLDYRWYGVPILPIGCSIQTSARKYEDNGWLRTNLLHLYLWQKQAKEYDAIHKEVMNYENSDCNLL